MLRPYKSGVFIWDLVYLLQSPQAKPRFGRVQVDQQQAAQYHGGEQGDNGVAATVAPAASERAGEHR